jgi:serine protease Do
VNPGNSGGALVDLSGELVGVNTAIFSRSGGSNGIGFAIPSEMVQQVIAAEKSGATNASALRPWIGVSGQSVTRDIASSLGLSKPRGVLVAQMHKESPARKAGLEVGDIITAVNGRNINDPAEMKFRLATVGLGDKADLDIIRKGKELTLRMKAIQPPEDPPRNKTTLEGNHPLSGAVVGNLNPRVGVELGIDSDREGVVVFATSRYSRLVRAGDIILSVNDDDVEDIKDLQKELRQAQKRGVFDMVIERDGRQSRIVIR